MYHYFIYGKHIASDYMLEEAYELREERNTEEKPDITIKKANLEHFMEKGKNYEATEFLIYWYEDGGKVYKAQQAGYMFVKDGHTIEYQLYEDYNPLMVNQMFLCAGLPMALNLQGQLLLHGSGLLFGEKAIAVSGYSGAGKSTLSQALLKNGAIFMADDTVALVERNGRIYAQAAYPQQKICVDAIDESQDKSQLILLPKDDDREKYAVRLKSGFCMEEKPLQAMFILQAVDLPKIRMTQIRGSEKLKYLTDNLYNRKNYLELGMGVEMMKKCISIADKIDIYLIERPVVGMSTGEQVQLVKSVVAEKM